MQIGVSRLTFVPTHLIGKQPQYHFAINIPTNQINEAADWLRQKNLTPLPIPVEEGETPTVVANFRNWNAQAVYVADPQGNIVELISRHDLLHPSSVPFAASSFISLSEIGLVNENVVAYAKTLREKYDVLSFPKNDNTDNFWALGADNGLLLVSKTGRNWYPTEVAAVSFPLLLQFKNRKNVDCELEIF